MKGLAAFLVVTVALSAVAEARMHHPYRGHRIVQSGATPELPLDNFTTPTGAYSFRKLKSTYAGPAIRIRRASDNLETDINFLGYVPGIGSPWDAAAANSHCNATTCFLRTWYDQSGTFDLVQATTTLQPQLIFNCIGSLPCARIVATLNTYGMTSVGTLTPITGAQSISVVGNRNVFAANCFFWRQATGGLNRLSSGLANFWGIAGSAGTVNAAATDAAWHAGIGVINGASSSITIDGVTTAGSVTNSSTVSALGFGAQNGTTCSQTEMVLWDNYILTPGEIAALTANQRGFWGTP